MKLNTSCVVESNKDFSFNDVFAAIHEATLNTFPDFRSNYSKNSFELYISIPTFPECIIFIIRIFKNRKFMFLAQEHTYIAVYAMRVIAQKFTEIIQGKYYSSSPNEYNSYLDFLKQHLVSSAIKIRYKKDLTSNHSAFFARDQKFQNFL